MSVPSWAKPGVKVVCVNAADTNLWGGAELVEGRVYTLSGAWVEGDGDAVCAVHEWRRMLGGVDLSDLFPFHLRRFRPLVFTKSEAEDVAMFHDIARQAHRIEERA